MLAVIGCCALLGLGVWQGAKWWKHVPQQTRLTHQLTRGDLVVSITEQGILESSENIEIKSKVRGRNTVLWVIDSGETVQVGDELVRLDSSFIQEQIDERTKYAHWSRSAAERSAANVKRSALAVHEYEEGRFVSQRLAMEKDLVLAKANLRTAEDRLGHAELLAGSGYSSELDLEERRFARQQAELNVSLKRTQLDVLKRYTHAEQLQTLTGQQAAVKASHEANVERAMADASRRDRALEEIQHCTVRAERAGLVIHPNAAKWESAPIAEGASVYKNQVLLLMPNLEKMQVKIGVHEAAVDRLQRGQIARVTLANRQLDGTVSEIASVTRPAGWWTGNEVRYDTKVALPAEPGLMPGMSAEVEIVVAKYTGILTIPVAAIVTTEVNQADGPEGRTSKIERHYCWVETDSGPEPRAVQLGDTNGVFTQVKSGVTEGTHVILNPAGLALPASWGDAQTVSSSQANAETDDSAADAPIEAAR